MFSLAMNKTEKALLKSALEPEIESECTKKGQGQRQRRQQGCCKGIRSKGRQQAQPNYFGKNAKPPKQTIPEEKETLPEDEEELINMTPGGTIEVAMEKAKEWDKEGVARGVRRTRTTSKAHHACDFHLQMQGMIKGEAQAVGRVAGRLVGAMFDKDCPLATGKGKAKAKVM